MPLRPSVLLVTLLALPLVGAPARAGDVVDGIAAQVGGEIVLVSEVERAARRGISELEQAGAPASEIAHLRAEVLERMIERALIKQIVQRAELGASDAEVDQAIADIAAENGITSDDVRNSVRTQGMSWEIYRERIRGEIEQAKVMNGMVASRVRVNEDEIRACTKRSSVTNPPAAKSSSCA